MSGEETGAEYHPPTDAAQLVQELLDVLQGTRVNELDVEWQGVKVRIRREPVVGAPTELGAEQAPAAATLSHPEDGTVVVPSVYVGIFRRDADAELPQVGDQVAAGARIGEIEVLGVRNPVTVPTDGVLAVLLVDDGAPVEYGQPLALLRPHLPPADDHGEG